MVEPRPIQTALPAQAHRRILAAALHKLLRPLVRVLLRGGIPYGLFADIAKQVYIDIADEEFKIPGRKQTVSRVSIITGLSRKEISRVKELADADAAEVADRYNRAARVISGWVRDNRFRDDQGEPVALDLEGQGATFTQLVKDFSGDVPPRAILDELINVGAVESQDDGRIRLVSRAYVPRDSKADKLGILGTDVAQLIATIDHNVHQTEAEPRFQRKVSYDNLPEEALEELRQMSGAAAQALLEKIDRWLQTHDRDSNPNVRGTGRKRSGLGIYYFEEDYKEGE
ncbi:MAG: DUF6502 family protein [Gammaproteobacteria bacterium]|nr:DUF6502 family protein [Gammaproteobacteria bacterium]